MYVSPEFEINMTTDWISISMIRDDRLYIICIGSKRKTHWWDSSTRATRFCRLWAVGPSAKSTRYGWVQRGEATGDRADICDETRSPEQKVQESRVGDHARGE